MRFSKCILMEIKRKLFHFLGLIFPIIYIYLPKTVMITLLFLITCIVIYIDNIRHSNFQLQIITENFFNSIMRDKERTGTNNWSGVSYFMSGLFISGFCFSKPIAIISWLILIISDSSAALTGKILGKPFFGEKSIEGTLAFFITALIVSIIFLKFFSFTTSIFTISFTVFFVTLIELYSDKIKINDNLTIPISYGLLFNLLNYNL